VKPDTAVTVVLDGTVTPVANTIVTVDVAVSAPAEELVNPTS
jgi:hypothetical protein